MKTSRPKPRRPRVAGRKRPARLEGIKSTPGVCGGDPCIRDTRIPVWLLERARQLGISEGQILESYPGLRARDLVNAWEYVKAHRGEIERQIRENEED